MMARSRWLSPMQMAGVKWDRKDDRIHYDHDARTREVKSPATSLRGYVRTSAWRSTWALTAERRRRLARSATENLCWPWRQRVGATSSDWERRARGRDCTPRCARLVSRPASIQHKLSARV